MKHEFQKREHGFALIEVLIAVVVLAFGLLALAALQASLIRASGEAKAQSVALSLAKDKADLLRSYDGIDGYQNLQDEVAKTVDGDPETAGTQSIGGIDYTREVTVERYVFTAGAFVASGADTGAVGADRNEFKRMVVKVNWTDTNGDPQSVAIEDAVAALDPRDSARLGKPAVGSGPRKAKVLIVDPGTVAGVIPIALGGSDSTAATNPKPVLEGAKKGNPTYVETRFDVLTYAALSGNIGFAQAQARVETVVVGCNCRLQTGAAQVYRPTSWDGLRYLPPKAATLKEYGEASVSGQSPYCDVCCSSHHDDPNISGPKVSPYRPEHTHQYLDKDENWQDAEPGDKYEDACRFIRVDGIQDLAADPSNDFYNLVPTGNGAKLPTPSPQGQTDYKNFVLDYLDKRYAKPSSTSGAVYNDRTTPDPANSATALNLSAIKLEAVDKRLLHSRGLYVDYLEPDAVKAVVRAKKPESCPGATGTPTATEIRDCVLRALPFTSINLTEIAEWRENPVVNRIVVSNITFAVAKDGDKASVEPIKNASDGSTLAWTTAGHSASGLTGKYPWAINADDDAKALSDTQEFTLGAGGSGSTEIFKVNISALAGSSFAHKSETVSSSLPAGCTYVGTKFECKPTGGANLGGAVPIKVAGYNTTGDTTSKDLCKTKEGGMPYWVLYDIAAVTAPSDLTVAPITPAADGTLDEYSEFVVDPLNDQETVQVTIGLQSYKCPTTYSCTGQGKTVSYGSTYATCANPNTYTPTKQ